jgi:hypothetical protein
MTYPSINSKVTSTLQTLHENKQHAAAFPGHTGKELACLRFFPSIPLLVNRLRADQILAKQRVAKGDIRAQAQFVAKLFGIAA